MIASAITPAPITPSVDPWRGLIVGLYEARSQRQIETTASAFLLERGCRFGSRHRWCAWRWLEAVGGQHVGSGGNLTRGKADKRPPGHFRRHRLSQLSKVFGFGDAHPGCVCLGCGLPQVGEWGQSRHYRAERDLQVGAASLLG